MSGRSAVGRGRATEGDGFFLRTADGKSNGDVAKFAKSSPPPPWHRAERRGVGYVGLHFSRSLALSVHGCVLVTIAINSAQRELGRKEKG